jgi:flagellar protein FlgJ
MAGLSLSPISVAPALLQAQAGAHVAKATGASGDEATRRAAIEKASKDFETSFLSVMLGQMFQGVNESESSFTGGAGEKAFQSFMSDAMAKQMVGRGGVGLAPTVQKEMLKLQGLS